MIKSFNYYIHAVETAKKKSEKKTSTHICCSFMLPESCRLVGEISRALPTDRPLTRNVDNVKTILLFYYAPCHLFSISFVGYP